jgi:hypothetical protein
MGKTEVLPEREARAMAFKCGKCKGSHTFAIEGRACYAGDLFACDWGVLADSEDGPYERPCGAPAIATDWGFYCLAGHSHVNADVRVRQGWDYAHDPQEARQLMMAGTFPMTMDGSRPSEIAPY